MVAGTSKHISAPPSAPLPASIPQGWNGCMNMILSTALGRSRRDQSLEFYLCPAGIHEGVKQCGGMGRPEGRGG